MNFIKKLWTTGRGRLVVILSVIVLAPFVLPNIKWLIASLILVSVFGVIFFGADYVHNEKVRSKVNHYARRATRTGTNKPNTPGGEQ